MPPRPVALLEFIVSSKRVTLCVSIPLKENTAFVGLIQEPQEVGSVFEQSILLYRILEVKCELKASAIADHL
jgi:hypothetical protein